MFMMSTFYRLIDPYLILGIHGLSEAIVLRGRIAKRVREEAEKLGLSVNEYLVELLNQSLDPKYRAREYVEVAKDLLGEAHDELKKGNARQAAEKIWDAAALTVKPYAYWREGKRLTSHGELWEYKRRLEEELGEWVHDSWASATEMHVCFYEGWCTEKDIENAHKRVEKLIKGVASLLKEEKPG